MLILLNALVTICLELLMISNVLVNMPMIKTQVEQVLEAQNDLLNEMNNKMSDYDVRVMTRGGKMTQEPLYPEGHPKRIEQDSERINIDAPSPSKRKKKKNDNVVRVMTRGGKMTQEPLYPEGHLLGNVVISKKFLRTRKIMVMHSNERGECCPRTLVDRKRKRLSQRG